MGVLCDLPKIMMPRCILHLRCGGWRTVKGSNGSRNDRGPGLAIHFWAICGSFRQSKARTPREPAYSSALWRADYRYPSLFLVRYALTARELRHRDNAMSCGVSLMIRVLVHRVFYGVRASRIDTTSLRNFDNPSNLSATFPPQLDVRREAL